MSDQNPIKVHIEGWRRINHSYALVNRHQLRWMLRDARLSITHREMPYFKSHWQANPIGSFPAVFEEALTLPDQDAPSDVDITLRMDFPHRFDMPAKGKLVVFGTTEYTQISPENLRGDVAAAAANPKVFILTPSQWSAKGFLKLGFPQERIWVLPHGVDREHFRPTSPEEKLKYRAQLGIDAHAQVFLHVGGGWFGKGLDILIEAFSIHAKSHPNSRLVIKGHDALYGNAVRNAFANRPLALPPGVELATEQILYLGGDLNDQAMDQLYRLSDCYVATYRGEGFNMPLLEAAARGLEVLASAGGSADDFLGLFHRSKRLKSTLQSMPDGQTFIQVDRHELVAALAKQTDPRLDSTILIERELRARADSLSWEAVAGQIGDLMAGAGKMTINKDKMPSSITNQPINLQDLSDIRSAAIQRRGPAIHVAFCTDQTYIPQLGAAVVSLFLSNWQEELRVTIVSDVLTQDTKARFNQLALTYGRSIDFIELEAERFKGLVEYYQPKSAYYRLVLPELLPQDSKVIYLDSDLVVEANLRPLWHTNLQGNLVGAVAEREPLQVGLQAHIGLSNDPYVNSGVLLIDLEAWRREQIPEQCFGWIRANPQQATMMDQDSINVVCNRRKYFLDQKWNLNPIHGPPQKTLPEFPERILHFAGPIKPWHKWYSEDLISIFYQYLNMTPWKGTIKQIEPSLPGQHVSVANQLYERADFESAVMNYREAIRLYFNHLDIHASLSALIKHGDHLKSLGFDELASDSFRVILQMHGIPISHNDIYQIQQIR